MQKQMAEWWQKCAPVRVLAGVWAFHLLLSAAFIVGLQRHFALNGLVITAHLALVSSGIALLTLVLGGLLQIPGLRGRFLGRCLVTVLPASVFTLLLYLYAANYISHSFWGGVFTYRLAQEYIPLAPDLARQFNLVSLLHGIIWGLAGVAFGGYWLVSRRLQQGLETLFWPRRRAFAASLALLLMTGGLYGFVRLKLIQHSSYIFSEPCIGFLYGEWFFFQISPHSLNILGQDAAARADYPHNQSFQRRNVVLIITDALRADRLPLYGYTRPTTPFLTQLQQSGKLRHVKLALSNCPFTICGVPAIMASKQPSHIAPGNFTLPNLLHDLGYDLYFVLSTSHNWYGLRQYYGDEMKLYFDGNDAHGDAKHDDRALLQGLERVPNANGVPAYFQFHVIATHPSAVTLPEYRRYGPPVAPQITHLQQPTPAEATAVSDAYDDRVLQADAFIGKVFHALDEKGYLRNSLVVIVSDHGEGLGEHLHYDHGHSIYQEGLRIPLLIYEDTPAQYPSLKYATQADVAPTIAARLGLSIPSVWQGHSLLSAETTPYSFHQCHPYYGIYQHAVVYRTATATYKYIQTLGRASAEEFYELNSDPLEQKNLLATANPSLLRDLRAQMQQHQWYK